MTKDKAPSYETIRKIDVSEHIEKKNGLSYLSWAWALDTLLQHDPDASWVYPDSTIFPDGTVMIYCEVTAFGKMRRAHLPVLDHKNQPIKNPNAFQVNTAMQRCFVKAIALHGLGLYIYAGEDLPDGAEKEKEITFEQKQFERDYSYALECCKTVEEVDDLESNYGELPGDLVDATSMRRKGLQQGTKFPPPKYGFVNVEEAVEFANHAKATIDGCKFEYLEQFMLKNDHKIKALDDKLKAKMYNDGGSPSSRLFKAAEERIKNGK